MRRRGRNGSRIMRGGTGIWAEEVVEFCVCCKPFHNLFLSSHRFDFSIASRRRLTPIMKLPSLPNRRRRRRRPELPRRLKNVVVLPLSLFSLLTFHSVSKSFIQHGEQGDPRSIYASHGRRCSYAIEVPFLFPPSTCWIVICHDDGFG